MSDLTKITLTRLNDAMHFECANEDGNTIHTDGSEAIGGVGAGVRPMQLLLMAAASCSSIDVVMILNKMRVPFDDLKVEVTGEREQMDSYSRWKTIHLKFTVIGADVSAKKVEKAVKMSIEKYCSVTKTLEMNSEISYESSVAVSA